MRKVELEEGWYDTVRDISSVIKLGLNTSEKIQAFALESHTASEIEDAKQTLFWAFEKLKALDAFNHYKFTSTMPDNLLVHRVYNIRHSEGKANMAKRGRFKYTSDNIGEIVNSIKAGDMFYFVFFGRHKKYIHICDFATDLANVVEELLDNINKLLTLCKNVLQ